MLSLTLVIDCRETSVSRDIENQIGAVQRKPKTGSTLNSVRFLVDKL